MISNRELLQKADADLAQLTADGGLLVTGQVDEFIRLMIKPAVMLKDVFVTPMKNPVEERDKARFAGRVLQPVAAGTALSVAQRVRADLGKVTLTSVAYKAETRMDDDALEDNIERGSFKQTVMALLSEAVSRDIEFVAINGDVALGATALATSQDGWLVRTTTNIKDGLAARLSKVILRDALKLMPDEFARVERLKIYTNRQARMDYRDSLADRATALGDEQLTRSDKTVYNDIPVVAAPEFAVSAGNTSGLVSDPSNLVVGFHRKVKFETDRDISAQENIIVASVRFAIQILEQLAVVKIINIPGL